MSNNAGFYSIVSYCYEVCISIQIRIAYIVLYVSLWHVASCIARKAGDSMPTKDIKQLFLIVEKFNETSINAQSSYI